MLAVHSLRIPHGSLRREVGAGEAGSRGGGRKTTTKREEEEDEVEAEAEEEEEKGVRGTTTLYLTLHTVASAATSCARRVVPLVLEFSGTSGVLEWVVFRVRRTRSNSTGVFYSE